MNTRTQRQHGRDLFVHGLLEFCFSPRRILVQMLKMNVGRMKRGLFLIIVLLPFWMVGSVGNAWGLSDPDSAHISFFTEPLPEVLCAGYAGKGQYPRLELDYSKIFYAKIQILEPPVRASEVSAFSNKAHVQILEVFKGEVPILADNTAEKFYLHWGTDDASQPPNIKGYIGKRPVGKVFYILGWERRGEIYSRGLQRGQLHLSTLKACVQEEPSWMPEWLAKWWEE